MTDEISPRETDACQDVHLPPQLLEYFYSLMNSKVVKSQKETTFSDDDNVPVDFSIAIANPSSMISKCRH